MHVCGAHMMWMRACLWCSVLEDLVPEAVSLYVSWWHHEVTVTFSIPVMSLCSAQCGVFCLLLITLALAGSRFCTSQSSWRCSISFEASRVEGDPETEGAGVESFARRMALCSQIVVGG